MDTSLIFAAFGALAGIFAGKYLNSGALFRRLRPEEGFAVLSAEPIYRGGKYVCLISGLGVCGLAAGWTASNGGTASLMFAVGVLLALLGVAFAFLTENGRIEFNAEEIRHTSVFSKNTRVLRWDNMEPTRYRKTFWGRYIVLTDGKTEILVDFRLDGARAFVQTLRAARGVEEYERLKRKYLLS